MICQTLSALLLVGAMAGLPARAASMSRLLSDLEAAAEAGVSTPAERLGRALGGSPMPVDCLSPVLLQAVQSGRESAVGPWLEPPALPEVRVWSGSAGMRIHFTVRPDSPHAVDLGDGGDGEASPPRYVEQVAESLTSALDLLDGLGIRVSERHPWIDVYLAHGGDGLAGYVSPRPVGPFSLREDRGGFLVLDPRLEDPGTAAAHQLTHLALLGYSYREPVWWHEATAAWVGMRAAGHATAEAQALAARVSYPEDGLATDDLERARGNLLLPVFLSLHEDPPITVRSIWEECAALSGDNLLDAMDRAARDSGRGSLADLLRAFYASWVADTAGRSRLLEALGTSLPAPGLGADVTSYPAAGALDRRPLASLGATFLHFESLERPGGLALSVETNPDAALDALLLVRRSPRAPFLPVPLAANEDGSAGIRYPWSAVSDSLLLLVGLPGENGPISPSYAARYGPVIPFDLIEFGARSTDDGVLVEWTTDSETDLFGWNVYRGARPDLAFRRINAVPVPAGGNDRAPASYTFLDDSPRGRKFYYYVQAVTVDGFTQDSHLVGARPTAR